MTCVQHFSCPISNDMRGCHGMYFVRISGSHSTYQKYDLIPIHISIFQDLPRAFITLSSPLREVTYSGVIVSPPDSSLMTFAPESRSMFLVLHWGEPTCLLCSARQSCISNVPRGGSLSFMFPEANACVMWMLLWIISLPSRELTPLLEALIIFYPSRELIPSSRHSSTFASRPRSLFEVPFSLRCWFTPQGADSLLEAPFALKLIPSLRCPCFRGVDFSSRCLYLRSWFPP